MTEIIWEKVPTGIRGRKPLNAHIEFFEALKQNRGKTARAPEGMPLHLQTNINNGKVAGPGFEARTAATDADGNALPEGERRMWITYLGPKAAAKAAGARRGRKPSAE